MERWEAFDARLEAGLPSWMREQAEREEFFGHCDP
jgi:hypothetical protein